MVGHIQVKGGQTIPIRLMNPSEKDILIRTGTTVGQLSSIADVIDGELGTLENTYMLPEHLQVLFKETCSNLS